MPNPNLKPPLKQYQERVDIKKGLSRKMASHQNEPSTWWNVLNLRFYKQNIINFFRKVNVRTLTPTEQVLSIPSDTCQINSAPLILPPTIQLRVPTAPTDPVITALQVAIDGGALQSNLSGLSFDAVKTIKVIFDVTLPLGAYSGGEIFEIDNIGLVPLQVKSGSTKVSFNCTSSDDSQGSVTFSATFFEDLWIDTGGLVDLPFVQTNTLSHNETFPAQPDPHGCGFFLSLESDLDLPLRVRFELDFALT